MSDFRDFNADLIAANSRDAFWWAFYKTAFPAIKGMKTVTFEDHPDLQRSGIDRVLSGIIEGANVTVEEKFRPSGGKMDFSNPSDLLMEYEHRFPGEKPKPGWASKELACDFLAYAWEDFNGGYIMPWKELRFFLEDEGLRLTDMYGRNPVIAQTNRNGCHYKTYSMPIPITEFREFVSGFRLVKINEEFGFGGF